MRNSVHPHYVLLLLATLALALSCNSGDSATIAAADIYPDSNRPRLIPRLFAPGLISTPDHAERDITRSPDFREVYFSRDYKIMKCRFSDGAWHEAVSPEFTASSGAECEAHLSADGQTLYFISQRPVAPGEDSTTFQLWMIERDGQAWGQPHRLTDDGDFYPSLAGTDTLYFTDAHNDLCWSHLVNGQATKRVKLSDSVNTDAAEYNSFVAPDGSYLLFTSHGWSSTGTSGELYVSFRLPNGLWDLPKNLGSGINRAGVTYCPSVSRDGKYLFFSARWQGSEDIYWVDASILDSLRTLDLNFRDQLFSKLVSDGIGILESQLDEFTRRFGHFCYFDATFLIELGDRLLMSNYKELAVAVLHFSANSFPDDQTLSQKLKLALLGNDPSALDRLATELKDDPDLAATEERAINLLGYQLMSLDMLVEATLSFRLNVDLFPASANVYDSYAEALLLAADTTGAIKNYTRSLELAPDNQNARQILTRLEQL